MKALSRAATQPDYGGDCKAGPPQDLDEGNNVMADITRAALARMKAEIGRRLCLNPADASDSAEHVIGSFEREVTAKLAEFQELSGASVCLVVRAGDGFCDSPMKPELAWRFFRASRKTSVRSRLLPAFNSRCARTRSADCCFGPKPFPAAATPPIAAHVGEGEERASSVD